MKNAYINPDNTVREILPTEAAPIAEWYNEEFASHCVEVPDEVMPNWGWDPIKEKWVPEHEFKTLQERLQDVLESV